MDAEVWNEDYLNDDVPQVPDPVLIEQVEGLASGTALDLGCGAGGNAIYLATRGWDVTGIDFAPDGIRLARELAERNAVSDTCDFIVADTTTWQPPATYDLVICMYALPGGDLTPRTLSTAAAALAPGGTLMVLDFARDSLDESEPSFFEPDELTTTDEIVSALPDFEIVYAQNIDVQHHYEAEEAAGGSLDDAHGHGSEHGDVSSWPKGAFVRARRPR